VLEHKVLPVKYDEQIKDKLILAAVDPTIREMSKIAYSVNAKSYDVLYIPEAKFDSIVEMILPRENEFLKNLEKETYNYDVVEEGNVDEGLLEVEINKSALINLFEGALVEGVRMGASDIHIIPISNKTTDISFRTDGRLNTMAQAGRYTLLKLCLQWLKTDQGDSTGLNVKPVRTDLSREKLTVT
jgi:type IV pilus assembly protein PilB